MLIDDVYVKAKMEGEGGLDLGSWWEALTLDPTIPLPP